MARKRRRSSGAKKGSLDKPSAGGSDQRVERLPRSCIISTAPGRQTRVTILKEVGESSPHL